MEFPLQLRHNVSRPHATAALLVLGDDVSRWIAVVQHIDVPSSQLRFLIIHENRESAKRIIGALCVFPPGIPVEAIKQRGCLEFGCRVDRMFVPVDSCLFPEVSDDELNSLLPSDSSSLFVWHPSAGLIGFERDHVLKVADFLSPPPMTQQQWQVAEVDEQINRRIRVLLPEPFPETEDLLDNGQDDIGTESNHLDDAPRAPDEKSAVALRDGIQAFKRGIGKAAYKLTSRLPSSDTGSQLLGRLHHWAESMMSAGGAAASRGGLQPPQQNADSRISTRRENEIKRLLNMLINDPDKGLKYALPMHGDNQGRGVGDATDRLASNDISFDPSRLYGGGRTDTWDIPWEYQVKLISEYRQLAQREQKLGRYQRAAYIYAKLLHDLPASAAALEAGKYYHDAATIYIKHLNNPTKAANCLRNGGFWEEAVQIYRNREQWVDAGELYVELNQTNDAREMFGKAVQECEVKRRYAAAAAIADERLDDPTLASELLTTGWMQAAQGRLCLEQLMSMYGRRGMHDQAAHSLRQMTDTAFLSLEQVNDALTVSSENAHRYPEESVRDASRRHSWRLAAEVLSRNDDFAEGDDKTALSAIRKLAPADRLLQTDSQRFQSYKQQLRDSRQQASPERRHRSNANAAKLIGRYSLTPEGMPADTYWTQIIGNGSFIYRLGISGPAGTGVVVQQTIGVRRDGRIASQDRVIALPADAEDLRNFRLRLDRDEPDRVWMFCKNAFGSPPEDFQEIVSQSQFLSTPRIVPEQLQQILDVCGAVRGWLFLLLLTLTEDNFLSLGVFNCQSLKENTLPVDLPESVIQTLNLHHEKIRLHTVERRIYALLGQALIQIDHLADSAALVSDILPKSGRGRLIEMLAFPPLKIVASPSATTTRLVFSFEEGARAIWPEQNLGCAVAETLHAPRLAFSANGILAAACCQTNRIEFWRLNSGEAILHSEHQSEARITHLTSGPAPNQMLAFHDDGTISQLSIPVNR